MPEPPQPLRSPLPPPGPQSWRDRLTILRAGLPEVPPRWLALAATVGGVAVAAVVAVVALRGPSSPAPELVLPTAVPVQAAPGSPGTESREGDVVYVHAAGAVARPGVYRVPDGGRVADLLDAAGGLAPEADLDQVNLAARVVDGERVYVPRRGEVAPPQVGGSGLVSGAGVAAGPVNLNSATLEQLDALPGVGPATATAILDYRREHGRFRSIDELIEVRGIGEAKLAALRSRVRV